MQKSDDLKPKWFLFFWTSKQCFASHFSLASCILTVPEIIVQTQGSGYWQLIHWLPPAQFEHK